MFGDDFDAPALDEAVWLAHYLPAWSSREATRAAYSLGDSCLTLSIPPDQALWCRDEHPTPLRVAGIQSGNFSGPLGSTIGQQPFRPDLPVREAQDRFEGWLPTQGTIALRCRMTLSPRSMAALWLSGFEDQPTRSGEICVAEIFGKDLDERSAEVGMGLKRLGDPDLAHDFDAPRLPIDVTEFHTYAVTWDEHEAVFAVDDQVVRRCAGPPTYPLQLMLAVFDFPDWSTGDDDHLVPEFVIDWVRGTR